jgi:hypothetical protein
MSAEHWLTLEEAEEAIRRRLDTSVGRSRALLQTARASGDVRSYDASPVFLSDNDGIVGFSRRPGALSRVNEELRFSQADLMDWLDRQAQQAKPATKVKKQSRTQIKRGRAKEAIKALWPNEMPKDLPNMVVIKQVGDWLRDDCKKRNIRHGDIGSDTILRAAGRKK